jgi:excinuclease ABC subunit C
MIKEIVNRRYSRLLEEARPLPDLVVIDGGRGHLNAAAEELKKLGLEKLPVIGIAKEREHIYTRERPEPITLPRDSKALHLLERVRDEAHRFAIAYHKNLQSKGAKSSELDDIPGIGAKRRRSLISHFGSIDRIKIAGKEELLEAEGIDEKTAKNIIDHFKG